MLLLQKRSKKNKKGRKSADSSEESSAQSDDFERLVDNAKKTLVEVHLPPKDTTSNEG